MAERSKRLVPDPGLYSVNAKLDRPIAIGESGSQVVISQALSAYNSGIVLQPWNGVIQNFTGKQDAGLRGAFRMLPERRGRAGTVAYAPLPTILK